MADPNKRDEALVELHKRNKIMSIPDVTKRNQALVRLLELNALNPHQAKVVQSMIDKGTLGPPPEQPGTLDYLMGAGELALSAGTGYLGDIAGGVSGAMVASGAEDMEKADEVVRKVQDYFTYNPKSEAAQVIAGKLQEIIAPFSKAGEAVTEAGYDIGGPVGAAATATLIAAVSEILGLRGTKAAKKLAMKKVIKEKDISGLYDEMGQLLPEIKQGLDEAGMTMEDVKDILPESITEEQIMAGTKRVRKPAEKATGIRETQAIEKLAGDVAPDPDIIRAAQSFGLADDILASHSSTNPIFTAIEQGLKSIPGSQLNLKEQALIAKLGERADDIILEYGGEMDKAALSDAFRNRSRQLIDDLNIEAGSVYDEINEAIPKAMQVDASNIIEYLNERAHDLGGFENLNPKEKQLMMKLQPGAYPTYGLLDQQRKEIGQAMRKKSGPYKNMEEGAMKKLYGALAKDQQAVADSFPGVGDLYKTATQLVVTRKGIEDKLIKTIGKEAFGSITSKAKTAILGLQRGDTKAFDELMENLPEEIGGELTNSVIVSSLNDAFVAGSRKDKSINLPGFDNYMKGLKRNKTAYKRLEDAIGKDAMDRVSTLHTLVAGVKRAREHTIMTGRIVSTPIPAMFDDGDNLIRRMFGTAKRAVAAEGVSTAIGVPGAGTVGVVAQAATAKKTARSVKADALLASAKFRKIVEDKAAGRLDTQAKVDKAEKILTKLKEFKEWKETVPETTLADLAVLGGVGYLTGEVLTTDEEE